MRQRREHKFERWDSGISFNVMYPNIEQFKRKVITRQDFTNGDWDYIFKILNARFFDKVFRFTSIGRVTAEFSPRVEVLLTMIREFDENEGTDIRKHISNSASATYEESEDFDIDVDEDMEDERIGNRNRGYKTEDKSISYSINEIINRENRLVDYIEKKIVPLFSTRQKYDRKENYDY